MHQLPQRILSQVCYNACTRSGEIHELKEELRSLDRPKKKEAVKKVIAAMTVGKDVSMLFPDVVNCMQTEDLELKKLVYLYLINYAKTQPDLAIMAVNTFVKVGRIGVFVFMVQVMLHGEHAWYAPWCLHTWCMNPFGVMLCFNDAAPSSDAFPA